MKAVTKNVIEEDIAAVERLLYQELSSPSSVFNERVRPLLEAGGKRLRAKLCLLFANSGDAPREDRIHIAAAIELLHLATLVHDDVLDAADMRRGAPTISYQEGNKVAILSGDYLFAKTFDLISRTGNTMYLQIFTKVIIALVEGEFLQMSDYANLHQELDSYLDKTKKKTADFMEAAVELGARLGGYEDEQIKMAKEFGQGIGMLFQITDDMMDYSGQSVKTGKPTGLDLQDGLLTYPLLSIITQDNISFIKEQLQGILDGSSPDALVAYVRQMEGLEKTAALAKVYADQSLHALEALPDFIGKELLYEHVNGLLGRSV